MQTFRIHLDTAYKSTATPEELTAAHATITTAGGKDVSLLAHTRTTGLAPSSHSEQKTGPRL